MPKKKKPVKKGPALNPAQHQAAKAVKGPVLVIAGAGTGKTHTLVYRLVELVKAGVPAGSILLLTFTRRAAGEMIERASTLLAGKQGRMAGGTFHSFAHMMLKRHGRDIGLAHDFTVLDQADTFEILSGIRSDLGLSGRERGFPQRATIAAVISKAVNRQTRIEEILEDEYPQFVHEATHLNQIAKKYGKYKAERQYLDFDDLLVRLVDLLEKAPETRERIRDRYRYVMVDEYQDTNLLQARITRLLTGQSGNVMVVGDDAQSIYAFRGACYRNLFDFHKEYSSADLITLEQNYRSTQPVLDVANALMGQMSRSFRKRLFTKKAGDEKPLLVEAMDEQEQGRFVTGEVIRLQSQGVRLGDIAVLFRASRQAFPLELELQRSEIPYVKYGGFRFLEAAHIKDVLAYLRLVANPADDLSLTRVLMLYEGIGRAGARKIQQSVAGKSVSAGLKGHSARGKVKKSLASLSKMMRALERSAASPARNLQQVIDHYEPMMKLRFDDWPRRLRDLEQVVAMCKRYRSLPSMLTDLTLEPPSTSSRDNLAGAGKGDRLVLSTMHSAKGLEWEAVFIIQALDGSIPMMSPYDDEIDTEKRDEELRLLYVAVTRAKRSLSIVWPRDTSRGYGFGWASVSRFVDALPKKLLVRRKAAKLIRTS